MYVYIRCVNSHGTRDCIRAPLSMRFQDRIAGKEGAHFYYPGGDLPTGIRPVSGSSSLTGGFFITEYTWERLDGAKGLK